jgi:hypothetical protein
MVTKAHNLVSFRERVCNSSAAFFLVIRGVVSDLLGEHTNETGWHSGWFIVDRRCVADAKMDRAETSP